MATSAAPEFRTSPARFRDEDLIPEVDVLVTLTNARLCQAHRRRRVPHPAPRWPRRHRCHDARRRRHSAHPRGEHHDSLLVFTNRGKVYQLKVHELPDAGRTAKGVPIVNLINMQPDETVTTLMKVRDYTSGHFLFFTTRLGRVKRTALDQFQNGSLLWSDRDRSRPGGRAGLGADDERRGRHHARQPGRAGDPLP